MVSTAGVKTSTRTEIQNTIDGPIYQIGVKATWNIR